MNKRVIELAEILNNATKHYDQGTPIMSDRKWDNLYFELENLEKFYGETAPNSPTQNINFVTVSELKKVKHSHPMLSLQKTKSIDELKAFVGNKDYVIMLKLDGLTCSVKYENGRLVSAETRGNGEIGEDITHNAFGIKNLPKRIDFNGDLIIDGEIICTYKDFEEFKDDYKNPRNFAAGSIRLLDGFESSKRKLSFIAWDLISISGLNPEYPKFELINDKLSLLEDFGFETVEFAYNPPINEYTIDGMKQLGSPWPIDGLVIKLANLKEYEAAGRTDHHFKGGIAYKFYDEEYETTLLDIEYTMGRTGVLTPVAVFEPIEIDGTIVERASLHNLSVMDELSQGFERRGDRLWIYKANEIIPQVSKWEHIGDYNPETHISLPSTCPVCGAETAILAQTDSKFLVCNNPNCEGKLINKFEHFCGKKGLDIKGLSKATLGKLIEWEWISTFKDIFQLKNHRNEWIKKNGFGEKSVDNILDAIENAKNVALDKFLCAIGIPLLGSRMAKELCKHIESYEDFRNKVKNKHDFAQYDTFGEQKSDNILNFDYTDADAAYEELSVQISESQAAANSLEGQTFVITGKLINYKNRDELKDIIETLGGKVASGVSGKTTALINNDINSTSSKNQTAKKLGVPIITEEEFKKDFLTF